MISKRRIALGTLAGSAALLVAGILWGVPVVAWLSGGVLAALVVAAMFPQRRDEFASTSENSRATPTRRVELWQALTALGALSLLILGVSLENPFFTNDPIAHSLIFSRHSLVILSTEAAFALIIALAISVTIEKHARERDNAAHDAMRKRIAEDVFRGVFSAQLPASYIDAVVDRNLKVRFIRPWLRITEDISSYRPSSIDEKRLQKDPLFRCDRLIEYAITNVTTTAIAETLKIFFPIKQTGLAEETGLDFLCVGARQWSAAEIAAARVVNEDADAVHYEFSVTLPPREAVEIRLHTRHFKYADDSELWSTIYPTMRFELSLRSRIPLRALGLRTTSLQPASSEYTDPAKGIGNWTVEGPLLPGDAITYWWSMER
jgi:hypothetical protein